MSKKIDMKKLTQRKGDPKATTLAAKGVVIGEKCPRDEMPDILLTKKGKQEASMLPPDDKKKGPSPKATSSRAASKAATTSTTLGERTSANLELPWVPLPPS